MHFHRALSYLSDGPNERIAAVLHSGVAPRLVELLANQNGSVQTPALRTVGNIVTGTDEQTQYILNLNVVPHLLALLTHPKKNIRKEACWTISNVTAGTSEQIQLIINHQVVPKLVELLHTAEFEIQKEAAWAMSNATSGGTPDQIIYLVQQGAIAALCNLLNAQDAKIITVVLEGLDNILKVGAQRPGAINEHILRMFSECGGLEKIEALQDHTNTSIYQRALRMLTTYFNAEEEQDSSVAPAVSGSVFGFGSGQQGPGSYQF